MAKTTKGRIVTSSNPKDNLELAAKVFEKHQADGATSPLNNLEEGYSWAITGPTIAQAMAFHKNAEFHKGEMEKNYRERDLVQAPIDALTNYSKNKLKGQFQKNPKKLADWGYAVDDTPPVKKEKKKPTA
jgi:hypothetical protein